MERRAAGGTFYPGDFLATFDDTPKMRHPNKWSMFYKSHIIESTINRYRDNFGTIPVQLTHGKGQIFPTHPIPFWRLKGH